MSNFDFLAAEWPELHAEATRAEKDAATDARTSCFYSRRTLELALHWLWDAEARLAPPHRDDLKARIREATLVGLAGQALCSKMDYVRIQGNAAVHRKAQVNPRDSVRTVVELFHVTYWLARTYTRDPANLPDPGTTFNAAYIPRPEPEHVRHTKLAAIQKLNEAVEHKDKELAAQRAANENLAAEINELRAQIAVAQKLNAARPDTHDYDEATTRANLIDLYLREAGWLLDKPEDREYRLEDIDGKGAHGFADYVLWDDNGKPLAVVEAKRTSKDPHVGKEQVLRYANALERDFGQRPVMFYTNGYRHHLWDDVNYPTREVQGFYTKDELRLLIQRRASRIALAGVPIDADIAGRYYQERAIRAVAETYENDNQRDALLVMATGSGKTRTTVALVKLLAEANWVKRVLFLADRQALVTQAVSAFKTHLQGMPTVNLLNEKDLDGRVFVSTYPTMMNLINNTDGDTRRFGPGYFDLIVIDEAHRSIYQKYGALFDYLDGLVLGLTATPREEIHRNTYRRFHLEDGIPTDVYDLEDAVADRYLVPPQAVTVPLKFLWQGIRYADLPEDEKEQWDEIEWNEDGTVPTEINAEEINRYLFNDDTIDQALKTIMSNGLRVAGGDRLGKTIIFAKNAKHAQHIADRFDRAYPEYKGEFARVITHKTEHAQSLIDKFAQREGLPHIAISVDMLDTGIDIPEVVNLVLFKPIRSKTKFWQMIGRGTRLCPDLFGPNQDKDRFYVFDLCRNFEYFSHEVPVVEEKLPVSLGERLFRLRADLILALADSKDPGETALRSDTARRLRSEVAAMNSNNFLVRPHLEQVEHFTKEESWQRPTFDSHLELTDHLASLPTAFRELGDGSEEAKRFDLLALRLQLAVLQADPVFDSLRAKVQEIAEDLLTRAHIPRIAEQHDLLEDLAGDEWWRDVTVSMLETMRRKIRGIVRLVDKSRRAVVYTDFEDELGALSLTPLNGLTHGHDWTQFEAKARVYLRTHEDDPVVRKLRLNEQITVDDIDGLEIVFRSAGIAVDDDLVHVSQRDGGLGLFLRELSGLDREAVVAALDEFRAGRHFNSAQLNFLRLLTEHLTRNGVVDVEALYKAPYNAIDRRGPDFVFGKDEVDNVVSILDRIRKRAIAQAPAA